MVHAPKADHRKNWLLAAVAPEDCAALEPHLELVQLPRGQILYEPGAVMHHIYFPHEAVISLVNLMEDGGLVEVGVFGREGASSLNGALATREAFGRYVVQMPGTASRIGFRYLDEVRSTSPRLLQVLTNYGEALLAHTFQTVSCNAVHGIEARCCRWILSMDDRADGHVLPLTHEFLAEMLGVQRSSVSVVTRTLQMAGLIQQGRGSITVTDRAGLEETVCECYGKIRSIYQRLLPGTFSKALSK
ncbi:Crp/Fnr family transcriptional regulator [Microvirga lotononidis]|uniref:cAMP-binding protein n=1 Tax=Microvirga lotononidis TaxID=864069 RepID=I4YKD8_9HYPH|nr:Crp/Fnr family transcriptional regulator [Microvirga lotononidis]EIM24430.1 cAMP-binding protein [Microvirga lotononidis]WQO31353.1 Crp/Fnr family transcriptional regulator [Microvirga lotononidis]